MSESNNNTPMRITQLEEATSYPEDSYIPIAKAGWGTKKINQNVKRPTEIELENNLELYTGSSQIPFVFGEVIKTNTSVVDTTPITLSGGAYAMTDCTEGDIFYITAQGYTGALLYAFIDSENNRLTYYDRTSIVSNLKVIAPKNASKIIVNDQTGSIANPLLYKGEFVSNAVSDIKFFIELNTVKFNTSDFEEGGFNPQTGVAASTTTKCRRLDYIDSNIIKIEGTATHKIALFAYNKTTNAYEGCWDGSSIATRNSTPVVQNVDITLIPNYKDYKFKVAIEKAAAETAADAIPLVKLYVKIAYLQNEIKNIDIDADSGNIFKANDEQSIITSSSALFALYDQLVTDYPNYVTKNTLTSNSFENYEYVFSSGDYNNPHGTRTADATIKKPIILIMSGVHGDERSSITSTYAFFKALCENKPFVARLKEMFIFKVIPLVTPWGLDNNKRWNANGVNINRNFNADWVAQGEPYTNSYSGESAASEDETIVVQNWLDDNTDALFELDYHNSGYTNEVSYLSINNSFADAAAIKKGYRLNIDNYIGYWQNERRMISSSLIYEYTGALYVTGSTERYCYKKEICSSTLEASWNQNSTGQDSVQTIGVGAEVLAAVVNGIAQQLVEY